MAAKSSTLGTLHELFAAYWMDRMQEKVDVYDADGEVIDQRKLPLTAAEAAVLRAFLKDNNVQADVEASDDVKDLAKHLREATAGTVASNELDDIIGDFQRSLQGGTLQ